jgi:hypothetical protein
MLGLYPCFEWYYNDLNGQLSTIITLSDAASNVNKNCQINELTTEEDGGGSQGGGHGRG